MKKKVLIALAIGVFLFFGQGVAEAGRSFTVAQTNPVPASAVFTMGDTAPVTFTITNTNNGGQSAERIYQVTYNAAGATTFSASTAAPVGWTRTAYAATSVTFRANTWANAIAVGSPKAFTVQLLGSNNIDVSNNMNNVTVYYSAGFPFIQASNRSAGGVGGWSWKSLAITSFQITDLSGTPISALAAGGSFRLVMTITNRSTVIQNGIVSNTNPPTAVKIGVVNQSLISTVYSPSPLNLASSAPGTITFTYSTGGLDNGTIYFTASARNGVNNATSTTATSPTLTIVTAANLLLAAITVSPACAYNGQNITITMALTNGYTNNIINVTPTLTPSGGAPVSFVSGPAPAAPNGPVLANNAATFSFQWVYLVTGGILGQTFTFSGSATGTEQVTGLSRTAPAATSPIVTVGGYNVSVSPLPAQLNALSSNMELMWTFTNQGCANVNSVSIAIPAGWTLSAGDNYSLVNNSFENVWIPAGANPVTFTSPSAVERLLSLQPGEFRLVFSSTPTTTGANTFNVTITDSNGASTTLPTTVTVSPYNSGVGGGNYTGTGVWQEVVN